MNFDLKEQATFFLEGGERKGFKYRKKKRTRKRK